VDVRDKLGDDEILQQGVGKSRNKVLGKKFDLIKRGICEGRKIDSVE
jgi:hypothetical protein